MNVYLLVFIGSGLGGLLRYSISRLLSPLLPSFPIGTLTANLIGMFLIGMFAVWFVDKGLLRSPYKEMLIVGFLGGLTTFSSFGNETFLLLKENKFIELFLYLSGNLIVGFFLLIAGRYIAK